MEDNKMTRQEMIIEILNDLGYKPTIDQDGDICLAYQMKNFYFITGKEEEQYIMVVYPQFSEVQEGEETLTLAVCNRLTRDVRLAKVYIDNTLKHVSASCGFFYTDTQSLKHSIENTLNILGRIHSLYRDTKEELEKM